MHTSKVDLCVPCKAHVHSDFAFDLARATGELQSTYALGFHYAQGTYIFEQRESLVRAALDSGADVIVFIDSDMRFTSKAVRSVVDSAIGGTMVVGANYLTRMPPHIPVARDVNGFRMNSVGEDGLQSAKSLGFGLVAIPRAVLEEMETPYFPGLKMDAQMNVLGEDTLFCHTASALGFDVMVDHDASFDVAHIGEAEHRF